jgi:hypothetical protein
MASQRMASKMEELQAAMREVLHTKRWGGVGVDDGPGRGYISGNATSTGNHGRGGGEARCSPHVNGSGAGAYAYSGTAGYHSMGNGFGHIHGREGSASNLSTWAQPHAERNTGLAAPVLPQQPALGPGSVGGQGSVGYSNNDAAPHVALQSGSSRAFPVPSVPNAAASARTDSAHPPVVDAVSGTGTQGQEADGRLDLQGASGDAPPYPLSFHEVGWITLSVMCCPPSENLAIKCVSSCGVTLLASQFQSACFQTSVASLLP